jgi:hypothetical protein
MSWGELSWGEWSGNQSHAFVLYLERFDEI